MTRLADGRAVIVAGKDSPTRPGAEWASPPQAEVWDPAAPNDKPYSISYPPEWGQGWMGDGLYPFMAVLPKGESSGP